MIQSDDFWTGDAYVAGLHRLLGRYKRSCKFDAGECCFIVPSNRVGEIVATLQQEPDYDGLGITSREVIVRAPDANYLIGIEVGALEDVLIVTRGDCEDDKAYLIRLEDAPEFEPYTKARTRWATGEGR